MNIKTLDCTLRDGGYYNNWDFPLELVNDYLKAMSDINIDFVEIGLRSLKNKNFKGPYAYSTNVFLESLNIPSNLKIGVMINASEIIINNKFSATVLKKLFVNNSSKSIIKLIRIACHFYEFEEAIKSAKILKKMGYIVGFNLMQIAQCSKKEIISVGEIAQKNKIDVLYFADSLGGMNPTNVSEIVNLLKNNWSGEIGIHTHDNMGLALQNTLKAMDLGVSWLDTTVTGMGRGPGNAKTEELAIHLDSKSGGLTNMTSLFKLINNYFKPLKKQYEWGKNVFYFLSGKYGIHPTYIQKMISDSRYDENDILAVIDKLKNDGRRKFNIDFLNSILNFYSVKASGSWSPKRLLNNKDLLILATGPGVSQHRKAIENYINLKNPIVMALNTQSAIESKFINFRIACHPVRLLADCKIHLSFKQPLITPFSMLPKDVKDVLSKKEILDFGMEVKKNKFQFNLSHCITPNNLVMSYAFAVAASGCVSRILLAGFDGYKDKDPRNKESSDVIKLFSNSKKTPPIVSITPSRYDIECISVYGLLS